MKMRLKKPMITMLVLVLVLVLLLTGAFFIYVSDYYRADDMAIAAIKSDANMSIKENLIILSPPTPQRHCADFLSWSQGGMLCLFAHTGKN